MPIIWVEPDQPLPDPAKSPSAGLIAAGRDLSAARLQEAYGKGLFPWFGPGDPILWWSPDPRAVLRCTALHVSRSLAKRVRQFGRPGQPAALCVTLNQAFAQVIGQCARRADARASLGAARLKGSAYADVQHAAARGAPAERMAIAAAGSPSEANGTWITPDIMRAYGDWHVQGRVHSVETWVDGRLAGGLYGVSLGGCFFGESMFSRVADASKVALVYLVAYLQRHGVEWIDCQQDTPHLARLGSTPIARGQFLALLAQGLMRPAPPFGQGRLMPDGTLITSNALPGT